MVSMVASTVASMLSCLPAPFLLATVSPKVDERTSFIGGPRRGEELGKEQTTRETMPITLEAARAAAQQRRWHSILGLRQGASADDIRKARRRLQLTAHTDKGGSKELSQLINLAADELLERCPKAWVPHASEEDPDWWGEFLREAKEELERRRRREQEGAQRAAWMCEEKRRRDGE